MVEAVKRAQSYAVDIEHIMRKVFQCERFGFSGIVNSDFIRRSPLAAVTATCGFLYSTADADKRKHIEDFLDDVMFYIEMPLDELLSFYTSTKTIDLETIELEYENGEAALIDIIERFTIVCS